jgi:hypothetical protein
MTATAMSPYPSSPSFLIVGHEKCRRVFQFQRALDRLGFPAARVVPWRAILRGEADLRAAARPGDIIRIESPGRDFGVERLLLEWGAEEPDEPGFDRLPAAEARDLPFDHGRIHSPRQWFLGFCRILRTLREQLAGCPPHTPINDPSEIEVMFDKRAAHARLSAAGVAVPVALPPVSSWAELEAEMERTGIRRVFIKPAHGSSASGVVAYQRSGERRQASTTVEMVERERELCLYNSRRVRVLRDTREIEKLVDALCRHRLHVEQWLPKAGMRGKTFDLRVVVIAGRARHTLARLSRGPLTNLHLLNERAPAEAVQALMSPSAWDAAMETCERAAAAFPRSLHLGVDLLICPDFRTHAVLEVNAFGDLLPGLEYEGRDTYQAEIEAVTASALRAAA